MAECEKMDESSFEDFGSIGEEQNPDTKWQPMFEGTFPADDGYGYDSNEWVFNEAGTIPNGGLLQYQHNAWSTEQLRVHADYAAAARKLCPPGKEFLYMLPAFPILKAELSRCGANTDLSYLDGQSIGARIREGMCNGYRVHWEKVSAEELICGWFGLIYYYGVAPQYHLRVVAEEMAEYMKNRQDLADLCESVD